LLLCARVELQCANFVHNVSGERLCVCLGVDDRDVLHRALRVHLLVLLRTLQGFVDLDVPLLVCLDFDDCGELHRAASASSSVASPFACATTSTTAPSPIACHLYLVCRRVKHIVDLVTCIICFSGGAERVSRDIDYLTAYTNCTGSAENRGGDPRRIAHQVFTRWSRP
jgi:hypothetical protein